MHRGHEEREKYLCRLCFCPTITYSHPSHGSPYLTATDLIKCVAWMPHGRSWMVLDRDLFVDRALPKYFNHKNFTSFIRIGEFALEGMMPLSSDLCIYSQCMVSVTKSLQWTKGTDLALSHLPPLQGLPPDPSRDRPRFLLPRALPSRPARPPTEDEAVERHAVQGTR